MEVSIIDKVWVSITEVVTVVIVNSESNPSIPINKPVRNCPKVVSWIDES